MRRLRVFLPSAPARAVLACALLCASAVSPSHAERLFVGILEADSYQSVIYGVSAFSRVADLPIVLESVNTALMQKLLIPSFSGVSSTDPLRIVQTVDPDQPLSNENPATVAILPLDGTSTRTLSEFSSAYATRIPNASGFVYEQPRSTNNAPRVAVATFGRYLFTSTSSDALAWAWRNRTQLAESPPQSIPGTLRILVNPQRLADILGTRSEKTASVINIDKLIRDFDTLSFALTFEGQALTVTLRGKPAGTNTLEALQAVLRPPAERLWNGIPENAFFSSLSASDDPSRTAAYLGSKRFRLLHPLEGLAPASAFTGDRLIYLAPNRNKNGLCFVQVEPLRETNAVRQAITKIDSLPADDGFEWKHNPSRQAGALAIESYDILIKPAAPTDSQTKENSLTMALATLFLKQAFLEVAVTDGCLLTVVGPEGSIEDEQARLTYTDKPLTLRQLIRGQNPALTDGDLVTGASLTVANLLRYVVSMMPGIKPEQLRLLASGGDGATLGLTRSADQTLTASLRIQSNELAALQRMNRDGREVLQELFFQMFTTRMMDRPGTADPSSKPAP